MSASANDFLPLLSCNVTPGALLAEPLSADEIDAHPDADRIWATVLAARELVQRIYDESTAAAWD